MKTSPYSFPEWHWCVGDNKTKCKEGEAQKIQDHLNAIERGAIGFTKEDQEKSILPMWDLKQKVNPKTKK